MNILLYSGSTETSAEVTTRAQLPLLLAQVVVATDFSVDRAEETDTAMDATVFIGAALIPADCAIETDSAMNATVTNPPGHDFISVDPGIETDTAMDVEVVNPVALFQSVDVAEETDTAFSVESNLHLLFPHDDADPPLLTPHDDPTVTLTPV